MEVNQKLNKLIFKNKHLSQQVTQAINSSADNQLLCPKLNQRELLIGLFLLQKKTRCQICEHFGFSKSRLNYILGHLCRHKFGVSGGGARYCQLFMASQAYKQIPSTMLLRYLE
jgi:hypothetical protein